MVARKTLAIIPARGGSKRLPGKNVKRFLGLPLVVWSIRFAKRIDRFDMIIVSTDSEEIAAISRAEGAYVPCLRSALLSTDSASSVDVALDVLARERGEGRLYDLVALLQPTSPYRDPARWDSAFALLDQDDCDAVIGVAAGHHYSLITGSLYLIRASVLETERTFSPARSMGIFCHQPFESIDIDTETDWIAAEALVRHRRNQEMNSPAVRVDL